jgi:L-alanine-DL-glutamate epimerase-like enolase superfamily enzyme
MLSSVTPSIDRRTFLHRASGGIAAALGAAFAATPASARSSKITSVEVIPTRVPMYEPVREAWQASFRSQDRFQTHYEPVVVKLLTDEGLSGVGDADMPAGRARQIAQSLVGRSPWDLLLDDSLGGILVAVYDLIGQAAGLPVSRLFSPSPRPRIVQTWWSQCFPPEMMASEARRGYDLGYRVHKVKARPWQDPIEQAAAISDAVPGDMRVWADANAWWRSVGRTLFFCERLSRFNNYFAVESPLPREHLDGYRELSGHTALQIAEHMPADPMPFVREGLLNAFVVGKPMGRGLVARALMAETTKIPLWVEHSISSGVNQVFQAHQAAALPGIEYCISITHVLADDLMKEPFQMSDGFYSPPTAPGLGVSWDEDAVERYRVA